MVQYNKPLRDESVCFDPDQAPGRVPFLVLSQKDTNNCITREMYKITFL